MKTNFTVNFEFDNILIKNLKGFTFLTQYFLPFSRHKMDSIKQALKLFSEFFRPEVEEEDSCDLIETAKLELKRKLEVIEKRHEQYLAGKKRDRSSRLKVKLMS